MRYSHVILLEWCCLELACLVQDKDAKSQEEGELQQAHDASLKGNNQSTCAPVQSFMSPQTWIGPVSATNSLVSGTGPGLQAGRFLSLHHCFRISEVDC